MKRFFSWDELSDRLKLQALAKLGRLAEAKVAYDGTVIPYAWAERVAPQLRYYVTRGLYVWDCTVTQKQRRAGIVSIWDVPILSLNELEVSA